MKDRLAKSARKMLPAGALERLETGYRKGRVKLVSARYGNPSKHLRVIAVTGTNGKTTTACYINEILKEAKFKTAMFTTALIEVAGTLQAAENAVIAAKVTGTVTKVPVVLGSSVKKGDLLVAISVGEIDARLSQAEAQLTQARRNLVREQN